MANPSLQIGNDNWAIKEDNLLGYSTAGTRFVPQPITMTRASAGTRVNSSGLVETVELLGSELVTNGDFSNGTTDWTENGGSYATIVSGALNSNNPDAGNWYAENISQNISFVNGTFYKVTFKAKNISGGLNLRITHQSHIIFSDNLTSNFVDYTVYYTAQANNDSIRIFCNSAVGEFQIDNISVKEATIDNLPRVDYTDGTSSLLVEPQRTNLITYSEDFTSGWSTSDATITANSTISPDGTQNASTLTTAASGGTVQESLSISDGDIAFSLFVKKGSTDGVRLRVDASTDFNAYFDLTDGTIHSTTGNAKIETLDNDWYKISVSASVTSFVKVSIYTTDGTTSYDNGTVFIWGAQLEEGSYATSYIPTDGSTVTRVQDQYSKTGISNLINSEEGVLFVEWKPKLSSDYSFISINNGSITDSVIIGKSNNTTNMFIAVRSSNVYQALYTSGVYDFTIFNKVAVKWKLNDISVWINGTESTNWSSGSSPVGLSKLSFDFGNGTENFYGKVKQLQVFKTALTDTELATLTTI